MTRYDFIIENVRAAGKLLMQLRNEKFETLEKGGDPRDIVTSVDFAVDDFIVGKIRESYPEDSIYSEEIDDSITSASNLWTVDPIDGSANFSRGIPHFAICLAFLKNGVPESGAVYNPITDELFSFQKGSGAFLNGKLIHVSQETDLKNSFVLFRAGRKAELRDWGGHLYRQLLEHSKKSSNLGGSALDVCFVAAGRVEAAIYGTLSTLDIAAAVGILNEAGGILVSERGELIPLTQSSQSIVAANSKDIADSVRSIL